MIHAEINVTVRLLFTLGAVLFLIGVLAMTMMPVVEGKPALQPSPRPTHTLPTLTPTPSDPPTVEPPTAEPPTAEPEPPAPEPTPATSTLTTTPTPTSTPMPVLLPNAGGVVFGCGLAGIGAGALLFGLFLVALRRGV